MGNPSLASIIAPTSVLQTGIRTQNFHFRGLTTLATYTIGVGQLTNATAITGVTPIAANGGSRFQFLPKRVFIRNNSGQSLWIGYTCGMPQRFDASLVKVPALFGPVTSCATADSGNSVTVTSAAHGLSVGCHVNFKGVQSAAGPYMNVVAGFTVTEVADVDTFKITCTYAAQTVAPSGVWFRTDTGYYQTVYAGAPNGFFLETSAIPGDYFELPVSPISELAIYNSSGSTLATDVGTCEVVLVG